jgi:hypothetical protein
MIVHKLCIHIGTHAISPIPEFTQVKMLEGRGHPVNPRDLLEIHLMNIKVNLPVAVFRPANWTFDGGHYVLWWVVRAPSEDIIPPLVDKTSVYSWVEVDKLYGLIPNGLIPPQPKPLTTNTAKV